MHIFSILVNIYVLWCVIVQPGPNSMSIHYIHTPNTHAVSTQSQYTRAPPTSTIVHGYTRMNTDTHIDTSLVLGMFSQVTDMSYMFGSATSFNQDLSSWDVSQVISASPHASHTCLHQIPILGIHNPPCIQHICVTRPSTMITHTQDPNM